MASSPLQALLEGRVSQLLADADQLADESRQRAVRDCTDRLNQAVRRIRQAASLADLGAALVDSSGPFAAGAVLFAIEGETALLKDVRGVEVEELPARFEIPLAAAPALAGAMQSRDPVTAAAVAGEVSAGVAELLGHSPDLRVSILPIVVRDCVPAVFYAWGDAQESALELLAQVAAGAWALLDVPPPPESPPPLVNIAGVSAEPAPAASAGQRNSWEELTPEEQRSHLRAQRFARVRVAQMRLSQADAVQAGRDRRDLYAGLREPIDAARLEFREKFFTPCPGMVDYLHLELVRTLANDDAELLGPDYPGPMV